MPVSYVSASRPVDGYVPPPPIPITRSQAPQTDSDAHPTWRLASFHITDFQYKPGGSYTMTAKDDQPSVNEVEGEEGSDIAHTMNSETTEHQTIYSPPKIHVGIMMDFPANMSRHNMKENQDLIGSMLAELCAGSTEGGLQSWAKHTVETGDAPDALSHRVLLAEHDAKKTNLGLRPKVLYSNRQRSINNDKHTVNMSFKATPVMDGQTPSYAGENEVDDTDRTLVSFSFDMSRLGEQDLPRAFGVVDAWKHREDEMAFTDWEKTIRDRTRQLQQNTSQERGSAGIGRRSPVPFGSALQGMQRPSEFGILGGYGGYGGNGGGGESNYSGRTYDGSTREEERSYGRPRGYGGNQVSEF